MTKTDIRKGRHSDAVKRNWKGKAPNSGHWKSKAATENIEKIGFAVVSVKVRPAEKLEFQSICKTLGVSPNWAMRSMLRHAAGFLEVGSEPLSELKSITRNLSGVATNINQIAKAGNRTLSPDYQAFMEDRRELGKELARLEQMMQQVLNVGRRRSDGLAMLKDGLVKP